MVFKCACMHSGVNKSVGFDEKVILGMDLIFWETKSKVFELQLRRNGLVADEFSNIVLCSHWWTRSGGCNIAGQASRLSRQVNNAVAMRAIR